MENLKIKQWFINANFSQNERYAASIADMMIKSETEKAALIIFDTDYGKFTKWVPKSCLMSEEDFRIEEERNEKRQLAFESGKIRYQNLIKFAKENNVKGVREGLRKETILNKISQLGIEVPENLIH